MTSTHALGFRLDSTESSTWYLPSFTLSMIHWEQSLPACRIVSQFVAGHRLPRLGSGTKFPVRCRSQLIDCQDKWQLSRLGYLERGGNWLGGRGNAVKRKALAILSTLEMPEKRANWRQVLGIAEEAQF